MKPASVLIVEDEAIVAADIEDTLRSFGYNVCGIVTKGEEVIKQVDKLRPDLVLMDIKLKGDIDGINAAIEIKKQFQTPVIYLTAHADESTLTRAKITEPYGYILKPFEAIELRIALELALYKRHLQPEQTTNNQPMPLPEGVPASTEKQALLSFLKTVAPFSSLADEGLKLLVSGSTTRKFPAGEIFALEGDSGVTGFLVMSGRVSMLKTSASGRELIVELLPPGDTFGLISTLDNRPYSFTCRAQAASEIMFVPRSVIVSILDSYPDLYRKFIDVISDRLARSHSFSRALAHDRVEVRIASALIALIPQFSTPQSSDSAGESTLWISITRQELANFTGTTVETAIRVTKAMERDGILDLSEAGTIRILAQDELTAIAGEDAS